LKNEDQKSNFYLDDDEDDFIESKDDLVLGIDIFCLLIWNNL
jgi:hypothetical protein